MDDRSDLAMRAEVLGKLADQLSEQLSVERRANEELRSLLSDGAIGRLARAPAPVSPLGPLVAGVAVVITVCAALAVSWLRPTVPDAGCPTRFAAASAAAAAVSPVPPQVPSWPTPGPSVDLYPNGPLHVLRQRTTDPRDCGPVVNAEAARCFVEASAGSDEGEFLTRNLILSYTILGERARARTLTAHYLAEHGASPFARQVRQLSRIND